MSAVSRRLLLRTSVVAGGAGLLASITPAAAHADGEALVAGRTPPSPLGAPAPGVRTEGARADHVHPTTGLVTLSQPSAFVVGNRWSSTGSTSRPVAAGLAGESAPRLAVDAAGGVSWGPGTAPADVVLARTGTREVRLSGQVLLREPLVVDSRRPPDLRRRSVRFASGGRPRWALDTDSAAETGSGNKGSIFGLNAYADSGSYLRNAFAVRRDTGDLIALPSYSPGSRFRIGGPTSVAAKVEVRTDLPTALQAQLLQSGGAAGVALHLRAATPSSAAHADGFGPRGVLAAATPGGLVPLGGVGAARRDGDTSGDLVLWTGSGGSLQARVRVTRAGNLLVGAAAAAADGERVLALADAEQEPSSAPAGAGVLYASRGALCFRGPDGATTVLAPA